MNDFAKFAGLALVALTLGACDVEQTQEGEMPEVSVEEGQMPDYDVETADVDVGTKEKTVEVPTVDVNMPDENETGVETNEEVIENRPQQAGTEID